MDRWRRISLEQHQTSSRGLPRLSLKADGRPERALCFIVSWGCKTYVISAKQGRSSDEKHFWMQIRVKDTLMKLRKPLC